MIDAEKLKTWVRDWSSPSVYASALLLLTNICFWDGVDAIRVFFFTFRGILAHHAGFEYSSDGLLPIDVYEAKAIRKLRANWYWLSY